MPTLTLKFYEWLAGVGALALLCFGLWGWGDYHGHKVVQAKWDAEKVASATVVEKAQVKAADVSQKVVTQYVDRVQTVVQKGETITKQVPVYIHDKDDAACVIPDGVRSLFDSAASGSPLPIGTATPSSSPAPASAASAR